jgi:hypothetical protein
MPQTPTARRYVELPNGSYLEWPQNVSASDFKAKAQRIMGQTSTPQAHRTAVDKMFPISTADSPVEIGPPHPRTGRAGVEDWLTNLKSRLDASLQRGVGPGAGDYIPFINMPGGLLKVARGGVKGAEGQPWQATKDIVGGGLQALSGPTGFMAPESPKVGEMAVEDAAKTITNAVNPQIKKLGNYETELAKHLDKIIAFAGKRGVNIDSIEGLWKGMVVAQKSILSHYYEHILGPVKQLATDITGIKGYAGETTGTPSSATLGQLDARLSQINAELGSKFAKGGIAGQQAVKSAEELNAERQAIQSVLYPRLGQVSGLGTETIADTREAFGSLRNLAEQTKQSMDTARHAANAAKNSPITINPFSASEGKQFVVDKAVNAMRGDPIKKAIADAARRLDVPKYELPEPSFHAVRSAPRTPIRGEGSPIGALQTPSAEETSALQEAYKARKAEVLARRLESMRRAGENQSGHAFWKEQP